MTITAVILAGGQSSRMGRDKALIDIQGQPLLQRTCTIALTCANPVYVLAPWIERYQSILPSGCQGIQEVPLPGESEPHGPLVAFAQALTQVRSEWVLLLACDLPNLTTEVIQEWSHFLATTPEDAIALLPRQAKGWEPLCGFYRRCYLPLLDNFIEQGGRSFQMWLSHYPVQELPITNPQILFNCNTPIDLAQIQV